MRQALEARNKPTKGRSRFFLGSRFLYNSYWSLCRVVLVE